MSNKISELLRVYENCVKCRYLDERLQQLFYQYKNMPNRGLRVLFSGIGAEVGSSMVSVLLMTEDCIIPHYRGFAEILGKGITIKSIAAEIFRRKTGSGKGIGDASPFRDVEHNIYGSSIVLGANFSIAVGLGFAVKFKKEPGIVVQFFGDGEASRSTFGSALNLASVWQFPILFVCKNNNISIDTKIEEMSSTETIAERAHGYNLNSETVSDLEPIRLYEAVQKSISYVREEGKPFLLEILERRFATHTTRLDDSPFLGSMIAPQEDPLRQLENALKNLGVSEDELSVYQRRVLAAVDAEIAAVLFDPMLSQEEFFSIYYE